MNLTMENLEKCFELAKARKMPFIGVKVQMPGFEKPEVIINPIENFDAKLAYYQKAYNDDLTLKTFSGIKIVGLGYGDSYSDIEYELNW